MDSPTTARALLLDKGHLPLPARGKVTPIAGWPDVKITHAWLNRFGSEDYPNTGLRCDNLVCFDLDTGSGDLIKKVLPRLIGKSDYVRGREGSHKALVMFRAKHPGTIKYYRSLTWLDKNGEGHTLEVKAGNKHQIIAYGTHPSGGEYRWPRYTPVTHTIKDVPSLSPDEFGALLTATQLEYELFARENGWSVASHHESGSADFRPGVTFDPDTVFTCLGGAPNGGLEGPQPWRLISEWLHVTNDPRAYVQMHMDGVRASSDSGAGRARLGREGDAILVDFAHRLIHRPHETERHQAYTNALRNVGGAPPPPPPPPTQTGGGDGGAPSGPPTPQRSQLLTTLLNEWAFVGELNACCRLSDPQNLIPIGGFKNLYPQKVARRPIVDTWLRDPAAKKAERIVFDPEAAAGIIDKGPVKLLNTYVAPDLGSPEGGEVDTFFEFLEHLIPFKTERQLVFEWLATKSTKPHLRLHGLVMVAPEQGTGRNTFSKIASMLVGEPYFATVSMETLLGTTYQAQYTDWIDRRLLVFVEEARQGSETKANDWNGRKKAYEHLKQFIDPTGKQLHIVRKGRNSTNEKVYAAFIIATNHTDALAIDDNDRRLIVVRNGLPLKRSPKDLATRINQWMMVRANIAKLWHTLRDAMPNVAYDPFSEATHTATKASMIVSNRSPMEQAVLDMLNSMRQAGLRYITADQAFNYVYQHSIEDVDMSAQGFRISLGRFLKGTHELQFARRPEGLTDLRVPHGGTTARVYRLPPHDGKPDDPGEVQLQLRAVDKLLGTREDWAP